MSQWWEQYARQQSSPIEVKDYATAAHRLVCEQVLAFDNKQQRTHYRIIETNQRRYSDLMEMMGLELRVNTQYRYACVIARERPFGNVMLRDALMALVLRKIYDEAVREGNVTEQGRVMVELEYLQTLYVSLTHREFPAADLKDILRRIARWGFLSRVDPPVSSSPLGVAQPFVLLLHPSIVDVLGETALAAMERWSAGAQQTQDDALAEVLDNADELDSDEPDTTENFDEESSE